MNPEAFTLRNTLNNTILIVNPITSGIGHFKLRFCGLLSNINISESAEQRKNHYH
jgi:hypothetical protein